MSCKIFLSIALCLTYGCASSPKEAKKTYEFNLAGNKANAVIRVSCSTSVVGNSRMYGNYRMIIDSKEFVVDSHSETTFRVEDGDYTVELSGFEEGQTFSERSFELSIAPNELKEYECQVPLPFTGKSKLTAISSNIASDGVDLESFDNRQSKSISEKTSELIEFIDFSDERIEGTSQEQRLDPGAKMVVERSRTITHSVVIDNKEAFEKDLSISLLNSLKGDIKRKIENDLGHKFQDSEVIRVSVTLDGDKSQKWKLVWYDRVRKGTARYMTDKGEAYDIPYRFTTASELEAIAVD